MIVVLTAATALYGLAMVTGGLIVGEQLFDRLGFGPSDGDLNSASQRAYARLIFGVLGGVLTGWMTLWAFVALGPFRRRERWSWWALMTSLIVWFVLDTGVSLALGWYSHAAFNVPFALALGSPLLFLAPCFAGGRVHGLARPFS